MFKISVKKGKKWLCSATTVSKIDSGLAKLFNLSKPQIVIHINLSKDKQIPSAMCTYFHHDSVFKTAIRHGTKSFFL